MSATLPGSIPGLLRRGCPVVYTSGATPFRGIVTGYAPADPGNFDVSWDGGVVMRSCRPDALDLDLSDPAGMDRAERWYAECTGRALLDVRRECWNAAALALAVLAVSR